MPATGIARQGRTATAVGAAALATTAALLLTACGGSGGGGGLGGGGFGEKDVPAGAGKGAQGEPQKLLLTEADLPEGQGLGIGPTAVVGGQGWQPTTETEARDPRCQVLFDMVDLDHALIKPTDAAAVELTGKPYRLTSMVAAYAPGQAQQLVASLTDAVPTCRETEGRSAGGAWEEVGTVDYMLPTVGDARVGYGLARGERDSRTYATVGIVLVGDRLVVTTATTPAPTAESGPTPDFKVIRAQVKKLTGKD